MPHLRNLNLVVPEKNFSATTYATSCTQNASLFVWETTTLITFHQFNNLMSDNAN